MADTPTTDSLVKKDPDAPAPDPIVSRTTSSIILVCALLLMASLGWALYDEIFGQRPWKNMQRSFALRYERYLKRLRNQPRSTEAEVKESPEYQELAAAAEEEKRRIAPRDKEIAQRVAAVEEQLAAITDPYQDKRGRLTVINYRIESAHDESEKKDERERAEELKNEPVAVSLPNGGNKRETKRLNYQQLDEMFNRLREEKSTLLSERAELVKTKDELERKRDTYLKDNMVGVSRAQVDALLRKARNFDFSMRQIAVGGEAVVDRCETCHLGVREPINITAGDMMPLRRRNRPDRLARAFVSHPQKELLQIHKPEQFGCASCHGGNGRATTSVEKAHGRVRFWTHPMHRKENAEAGCQQCHSQDRVLDFAPTLNLGKDLFYERGCVGCHRYEGFDRESDSLAGARQQIKQLEEQRDANEREAKQSAADAANASDDAAAQRLLARVENLRVYNSQLEARMDQLNTQARYLMQDQKKVGPNLKDVRLKLRKEWIPVWLQDPQKFRPGTKMPTYWRIDGEGGTNNDKKREEEERKAIAAYLWQESFDGRVARQPQGDAAKGKELFDSRGCLGCHSIGEPGQEIGGRFAANLTRVGEKASYDYIVRWIHNPRERWQPYCPVHKRDLTPDDYAKHNKPFVFNSANSRCPEDGAELQVQNMTVMPNFRLSDQDTRDIASYLFSLSRDVSYPDASYMDDPNLKEKGRALIKTYGCAGCHEMKGFEDEQRIGKELTTEGATPLERLDFALLTHDAERGIDPYDHDKKVEPWYNRRGFFENKLKEPGIYDRGKEKEAKDMLRMPRPYLTDEWRNALVTFLLGSVGREGANVPRSFFYNATDRQRDIQEGWWVIKKYNCTGCHSIQVGQKSVLSDIAFYAEGGALGRENLPPGLMTEGARVNPNWLLSFLRDPSLSGRGDDESIAATLSAHGGGQAGFTSGGASGENPLNRGAQGGTAQGNNPQSSGAQNGNPNQQAAQRASAQAGTLESPPAAGVRLGPQATEGYLPPQPGENRNGVRTYMKTRMPTFNFSPNELRALVRFFQAVSSQQEPFIQERVEPLTADERELARALFTSAAAPCLKCHVTGDP
ncbi:MAG TPA: c-type cytochrome, partial [Pyrinomonadaceae bacterium]|nr:c-type cytochrome [Pyrinomonadaceae bacterium]